MVTIVDYGVGNICSLANMLDHLEIDCEVASTAAKVSHAKKLILPGVGAFDTAMSSLRERSLIACLNEAVLKKRVPILGVCLGMQLLARKSEEGIELGLGWLNAEAKRLSPAPGSALKVPNI